jgi:hypothetical protein
MQYKVAVWGLDCGQQRIYLSSSCPEGEAGGFGSAGSIAHYTYARSSTCYDGSSDIYKLDRYEGFTIF